MHLGMTVTQAKGHEPESYKTLAVTVGLFLT